MTIQSICNCGSCQDAFDVALADHTKSVENGECLLWRIQVAVCMTAQCVELVREFFRREGAPMDDMTARIYVAEVMAQMSPFANDGLAASRPQIAAAFNANDARMGRKN